MAIPENIAAEAATVTEDGLRTLVKQGVIAAREVRDRSQPDAVRARIEAEVAEVRRRNSFDGILTAPQDAINAVERAKRVEYDEALARDAAAVLAGNSHLASVLDAKIEASKRLSIPLGTVAERASRYIERAEMRTQFDGRPVSELVAFYQNCPDAAPELVAWLEDEYEKGFPTLRLSAATDSTQEVLNRKALADAIKARREKRIPPRLLEMRAEIHAGFDDLTRMALRAIATRKIEPAMRPASKDVEKHATLRG